MLCAKEDRVNRYIGRADTNAWILPVWGAFAIALVLMFVGLFNLPDDWWVSKDGNTPRSADVHDSIRVATPAHLDENASAATWAEGEAMTQQQAIAYALQDAPEAAEQTPTPVTSVTSA